MKNIFLIVVIFLFLFSCKEKKPEFIQSKVYKNYFLLKNPIETIDDAEFYIYTKNWDPLHKGTSYFLDHEEDPGGFSSEELINYQDEDGIAVFGYIKCEKDTTKKVGIIRYFNGKYGSFYKPDTIIGKCK